MNAMISVLIVSAAALTSKPAVDQRHPDAVEVFHCDFSDKWDKNSDGYPDFWSRKKGVKFPHYLKVKLSESGAYSGKRSLQMELDGGAVTMYSPPIEVGPEFSYVLETHLKTKGLKHDKAYVSITFYDDERQAVGPVYTSKRYTDAPKWIKLRIGPVAPPSEEVAYAIIGLHLEPTKKKDIRGSANFDNIWFAHLPRMTVSTNSSHNIFTESEKVKVTCKVSGILERDPEIKFELVDISSVPRGEQKRRLQGKVVQRRATKASKIAGIQRDKTKGFAGITSWTPDINKPGFYRMQVTMAGSKGLMQKREITFAIVRPERPKRGGEFGWSVPSGDKLIPLPAMAELLSYAAVSKVKFPVWYDPKDSNRATQIGRFAERLAAKDIQIIGLLDIPPKEIRPQFGGSSKLLAADIFTTEPELWFASLEPIMTRLSSKINYWQLGLDQDTSFLGYPDLINTISSIKSELEKFGQKANIGMGWRWTNAIHNSKQLPWHFLSLSAYPPLTHHELAEYIDATDNNSAQRWAVIEPLARSKYNKETRAADLVQRMLVAKIKGVEALFIPEPFSKEHGLMNEDGSPAELFLTWRTTALSLSGSKYIGMIKMPNGSHNRIFAREKDAVMVVWNDKKTTEVIALDWMREVSEDDKVRQIDLWGRIKRPVREKLNIGKTGKMEDGHRHIIEVGPLPVFVTGVNLEITKMRMEFSFAQETLPSVFGKAHRNAFKMTNHFPQGVGGKIELHLPSQWRQQPIRSNFKMAAGEKRSQRFDLKLPYEASSGTHKVRVDFDINVDEQYKFSVYRKLNIGLGDVIIKVTTSLSDKGILIVKQEMINHTKKYVDFNCRLYAPLRRPKRNQVIRLGHGKDLKIYRFPNGKELIGKRLRLSAEEIDGQRTLNYTFIAKE